MDNLRGAALMVLAMAGFAAEDMFIKKLSADLPVGQILIIIGALGALAFAGMLRATGRSIMVPELWQGPLILRNMGELMAAVGFVTAIALTPLSSASAILQATPLAVTLGAALFLGEDVGWRRWSAIIIGFLGVLLIVRPGLEGFEPASLFAVLGVAGLALRDLSTRRLPRHVQSLQVACYGFAALVPAGAFLLALSGGARTIGPQEALWFAGALVFGLAAYYAIVAALRMGEVAVVMPFRYTRLIFALGIGITVFGERPDAYTLAGAALVVVSGLFTLWREARLARRTRIVARGR